MQHKYLSAARVFGFIYIELMMAGTDDDLPPSHHNRVVRGSRVSGNGRPAVVGTHPYPRVQNDMEPQIHRLEQEAYSSVLRAFKAQSDAISWVTIQTSFVPYALP